MAEDRYVITPEQVVDAVDEDTIGVVGILGTTYTGELEPIAEICAALDKLEKKKGSRHPGARRCRQRWLRRPVPQPDLQVGLPGSAGGVDQRQRPQVRPDLSGHGIRGGAALNICRRPDLQGQLSRR